MKPDYITPEEIGTWVTERIREHGKGPDDVEVQVRFKTAEQTWGIYRGVAYSVEKTP